MAHLARRTRPLSDQPLGLGQGISASLLAFTGLPLRPLKAATSGKEPLPYWPDNGEKEAMFKDFAGKTPVRRVGTSEDVAHAIAFLIDNDFVTGQTVITNSGLRFMNCA